MRLYSVLSIVLLTFFASLCPAQFQFQAEDAAKDKAARVGGPVRGDGLPQVWLAGIVIHPGAQMENVSVTIPVPMDWPEQEVVKIDEEKMDAALAGKIKYRTVGGGAREMVLNLANMRPHRKVEIVVAVNLLNYELLPPENTEEYVIPQRIPSDLQQYVKKSPKIECDNVLFKKMFLDVTKDKPSDWEKVEAIYRYVQDNVKYNDAGKAKEAKGALEVVRMPEGKREGDCKDMCCLFIAMCRAGKIPARLVRVPEHCYAEFYLELKNETETPAVRRPVPPKGFWFPCELAGSYAFGGIPQRQPILQKGDSYPDPDARPRGRKLFLTECFEGNLAPGSPSPKFDWVRELKGK